MSLLGFARRFQRPILIGVVIRKRCQPWIEIGHVNIRNVSDHSYIVRGYHQPQPMTGSLYGHSFMFEQILSGKRMKWNKMGTYVWNHYFRLLNSHPKIRARPYIWSTEWGQQQECSTEITAFNKSWSFYFSSSQFHITNVSTSHIVRLVWVLHRIVSLVL